MGNTKKQHFVHQGYLKLFFDGYKTIFVLDNVKKEYYKKTFEGIRDIASKNCFYDIDIKNEDPKKYEQLFADKFEPYFTNVLKNIVKNGDIEEADKKDLALFLAFQILRTPRFREWLCNFKSNLLANMIEKHLKQEYPEIGKHFDKSKLNISFNENHTHIETLFNKIVELVTHISKLNCHLILNKSNIDFLTSSEPVYANGDEHTGLLKYNCFIFNLTPKMSVKFSSKIDDDCKTITVKHAKMINFINKKILSRSEQCYITSEKQANEYKNKKYKYYKINVKEEQKENGILIKCKL